MSDDLDGGDDHVLLNLTRSEAGILAAELESIENGGGWAGDEVSPSDILEKIQAQL